METQDQAPEPEVEPVVFDQEKSERLSRFLALVLRHRAPSFDLEMDDEGFVHIDDLLDLIDDRQPALSWVEDEHLEALTKAQPQGRHRFEIRDDKIRATYGHSFRRPIQYPETKPPEKLYVGVTKSKLPILRSKGLLPAGRQYVHLSEEYAEAEKVASHQGEDSTVVTVKAAEAAAAGISFHRPTDGIFLVHKLPPEYMELEMEYGRRARKSRRRR